MLQDISKSLDFNLKKALMYQQAQRYEQAIEIYKEILKVQPRHIDSIINLGKIKQKQNKLYEAISFFKKALQINPKLIECCFYLGNIFKNLKFYKEAEHFYQYAISSKPEFCEVLYNLGNLYKDQSKYDEAYILYQRLLNLWPNFSQGYLNLGYVCEALNKNEDAILAYRKAINCEDNNAEARNNLGNILQKQGYYNEAKDQYKKALSIEPNYLEAYLNFGGCLQKQGDLEMAKNMYLEALRLKPSYAQAHANLGTLYQNLGQYAEALASYQSAINKNPLLATPYFHIGQIFNIANRKDQAIYFYNKAIEINPNWAKAYYEKADVLERNNEMQRAWQVLVKARENKVDLTNLQILKARLLKREGKYEKAVCCIQDLKTDGDFEFLRLFELGKLYDLLSLPEKAFKYFCKGNKLQKNSTEAKNSNKTLFLKRIEDNSKYFQLKDIKKWSVVNDEKNILNPVFIVGFPRSGTTLLDQILHSHPDCYVLEEMPTLSSVIDWIEKNHGPFPNSLNNITQEDIINIRKLYYSKVENLSEYKYEKSNSKILIDKLPLNIIELGLIYKIFPNAKIITALRYPGDVILSCFMQSFKINNAMANFFSLEDSVNCYQQTMDLYLKYKEILPLLIHEIRYENLVYNFKNEIKKILSFLKLDWSDSVEDYTQTAKNRQRIATPSYSSVINEIYNSSIYRWKKYQTYLAPHLSRLNQYIKAFGYYEI